MVRSYRSRDEIIVDILKAASVGAKKTHIMQRANLNPTMFKKYFPVLLNNDLIVEGEDPDGGSVYGLSEEGRKLLSMYRALRMKFRREIEGKPIQIL